MAVVNASYIRRGAIGNERAKDAVRYMQHRPERKGERVSRPLFGTDGRWERIHAYRMVDEAPTGTHFYCMSINPDPKAEDHQRDLDLRELTAKTIRTLEKIVATPVLYVAAEHTEHSNNRRHVYLLASVPRKLNTPELIHLRDSATQAALEQRHERELRREAREREGDEWEW